MPNPKSSGNRKIERLMEAIEEGVLSFQEDPPAGFVYEDMHHPLVRALEFEWPNDYECQAALWRRASELERTVTRLKEALDRAHAALDSEHAHTPQTWLDRNWE